MKIDSKKLAKGLKGLKVDSNDIKTLEDEAEARNASLYDIVQERHIVPDNDLGKLIAEITGYPYINLSKIDIPSDILEIIPENIAL